MTINSLREQSPMWFHNSRLRGSSSRGIGGKELGEERRKILFLWLLKYPLMCVCVCEFLYIFEGIEEERKTFPSLPRSVWLVEIYAFNKFLLLNFRNFENVRTCLLRTMCEAQHFLKPRGYSLLHDMLRTVFTWVLDLFSFCRL